MEKLHADIDSLQGAADVAFIENHLRRTAGTQLIYGAILVAEALLKYPQKDYLGTLAIGVTLGVEAMWLLRARTAQPVLLASLLLGLAALWDLFIGFRGAEASWIALGFLYGYFALREFNLYRRFRNALAAQTEAAKVELPSVLEALARNDEQLLQPHINGDRWVARLFDNGIVMRSSMNGEMLLDSRQKVGVEAQSSTAIGGFAKLRLKVRDRTLHCSMTPDEVGRLTQWATGTSHFAAAPR